MSDFEVSNPILNSAFAEPEEHWLIREGEMPERLPGRRPALVYPPRQGTVDWSLDDGLLARSQDYAPAFEMLLVNRVRKRVKAWREAGYPGASRVTLELLEWWRRDGRKQRLFFAQLDAVEAVLFLREARPDFRQGIDVPREDPGEEKSAQGYAGSLRYACKMATGSGKTTVMAMLAAWSILNKVNEPGNKGFSDVILVVCPNLTIKSRLAELDPNLGEASLYRTRDLVPPHLMPQLVRGKVLVTNWHVFAPQSAQVGDAPARVVRTGVPVQVNETILIGPKSTSARGNRYLTREAFDALVASGEFEVVEGSEELDDEGNLRKVSVKSLRYVESDTSVVRRILRGAGNKGNILVLNDEAHHAYRIRRPEPDQTEELDLFGEKDEADDFFQEATVWIDGLDRIQKLRGINFCVDLSATPYFLGRVGQETNRPFPWVVSDFGLVDAIESGLVKIPQLAVRGPGGAAVPEYFNVWEWVLKQLTAAERGGRAGSPKPEAVLKYAHHPIAMLGGEWAEELQRWQSHEDPRPPVFILVCKNTRIAKVIFEWLAEDKPPMGIPNSTIDALKNRDGEIRTIRVDTRVVHETDVGAAKSDEERWMRFTLDTVGRLSWPADSQGRPIMPDGFEELAGKLGRPLHPPGRDIRCIVSVGMLTEGWDCQTVTHIIGLRPFMSQLLCEQVVGRGLRRTSYDPDPDHPDRFTEEVAKVLGVPFDIVPFKATGAVGPTRQEKRKHVHALPARQHLQIRYPRVEGYTQAIRSRVTVDWTAVAPLVLQPGQIPPEVEVKAYVPNNEGRPSLLGPGRLDLVSLEAYRRERRIQELVFELARALTRDYLGQAQCCVPAHVLFPQVARIVQQYIDTKVRAVAPADIKDLFLAPYYGWLVERLVAAIKPDTAAGEAPEVPRYESNRGAGSTADVDFWTSRKAPEVVKSHVNRVVADTAKWEQSAAYYLDTDGRVLAFVKNDGLGFAVPYLFNGQRHDYIPDFIVCLRKDPDLHLVLETKGWDPLEEMKRQAAERWVAAVNADGTYGEWRYKVVKHPSEVPAAISEALAGAGAIGP